MPPPPTDTPRRQMPTGAHRLVLLHGFTQSHHLWSMDEFTATWRARGWPLPSFELIDLPGHGLADLPDGVGLGGDSARLLDLAQAGTFVGYSMGGRFGLQSAVLDARRSRRRIERLVLVGATAGLDGDETGESAADRVAVDEERAQRIERVGVDAFVDDWLQMPMFAQISAAADGRDYRVRNTAAGLAASLRAHGTGAMRPLWNDLERVEVPVLVVVGERDAKFTALGERLTERLPRGELGVISGAGHAAHTEQPAEFAQLVADWLVRVSHDDGR